LTAPDVNRVRHRRVSESVDLHARGWRAMVVLIALALAVIAVSQTGFGTAILRMVGLTSASAGYTALAFNNPTALPEQVAHRQSSVSLGFSIHNATTTDHAYFWELLIVRGTSDDLLASGSMKLSSGVTGVTSRTVKISCSPGREEIVVKLPRSSEQISVWLTCPS
jgi:hypothetical protein